MELSREKLLKLKNPNYYKKIRTNLKETAKKFIEESKTIQLNTDELPNVSLYHEFVKREQHTTNLFVEQIHHLKNEIQTLKEQAQEREKELYDTIVSMDKEIARLYVYEQEMNELNYQRTFRWYKKYYEWRKKKRKNKKHE